VGPIVADISAIALLDADATADSSQIDAFVEHLFAQIPPESMAVADARGFSRYVDGEMTLSGADQVK